MATDKSQIKQHLVFADVVVGNFGVATYSYFEYGKAGNPSAGNAFTLKVSPGDQVAWYVRVFRANVLTLVPYQLTFSDPSIFGTASLSVSGGGYSPYLQVRSLPSTGTKFTLSVSGITPADDPQIVVNGNGLHLLVQRTPDDYVILWQSTGKTLTYTKNGQAASTFPIPVIVNDTVTYNVQPAADFEVVFDATGHSIPTPFKESPISNVIQGKRDNGGSTGPLNIVPPDPQNPTFSFVVALDPTTHSDSYALTVSNPPSHP